MEFRIKQIPHFSLMKKRSGIPKNNSNLNKHNVSDKTNSPFFVDEKKVWNTEKQFKSQQAQCIQIHFDGNNHWTISFATDADSIFYIDSLSDTLKELKSNIKIQMSQIYWLVGCFFGFNGTLRQYFSLYPADSQREGEREEKG